MSAPDPVRDFVIAGHGNLPKVKEMLAANPDLLNVNYEWAENDRESAIQAAAHAGSVAVAEFLLGLGAPLEICTAAMLGNQADVEKLLAQDAARINARGAHGIPLLTHTALSGNAQLAQMLFERGAREGMAYALNNAALMGHTEMARWLLANGKPDLNWKNFQGKTALEIATEKGNEALVKILREHQ